MSSWWRVIKKRAMRSLQMLAESVETVGQPKYEEQYVDYSANPNDRLSRRENRLPPELLWKGMVNTIFKRQQNAFESLIQAFEAKENFDKREEYVQQNLSPVIQKANSNQTLQVEIASHGSKPIEIAETKPQNSPYTFANHTDSLKIRHDQQQFANKPDSIKVARDRQGRGALVDFFKNSMEQIIKKTESNTENLANALQQREPNIRQQNSPIKLLQSDSPSKSTIPPLPNRKASQKTIDELKKAIKEYQKEDYEELVDTLSKRQNTNNSRESQNNISSKNVTVNLYPDGNPNPEQFPAAPKSFKITRKNNHHNRDHRAQQQSPLQKNYSENKSKERIKQVKGAYSHSQNKKLEAIGQTKGRNNTEQSASGLKNSGLVKIPGEYIGKFEHPRFGHEFENSLSNNIDFLLSLKKAPREKLVKKEIVFDYKFNSSIKNLAQSDTYVRPIDKSKFTMEELELLPAKKQIQKKGIVKQKPFSIYHPSQRMELFKLH